MANTETTDRKNGNKINLNTLDDDSYYEVLKTLYVNTIKVDDPSLLMPPVFNDESGKLDRRKTLIETIRLLVESY